MARRRGILGLIAVAVVISGAGVRMQARAQTTAPASEPLGLQGYDPVAYFTLGKPTLGAVNFEHVWDGVRYRFASPQHLALFKAGPERYAPQFGGSCAMNMAAGNRREANPAMWTISGGRLFVFAGQAGVDRFLLEPESNAIKAAANWRNLRPRPGQ